MSENYQIYFSKQNITEEIENKENNIQCEDEEKNVVKKSVENISLKNETQCEKIEEESGTQNEEKTIIIIEESEEDNISLNEENITNETQESLCSVLADFFITALFFALYLVDKYSDLSLAIYFYLYVRKSTAYVMLLIIYISSLFSSIYERRTRNKKGLQYYASAIIVFIFNLSGILLYKDILILQLQKIKNIKNKVINYDDDEVLIKKKRELVFVKVYESFLEALPQSLFQIFTMIDSLKTNNYITGLQYFTFTTSFVSLCSTAVTFVNSVTCENGQRPVLEKYYKILWILFTTMAKLSSLYLVICYNYSSVFFMVLFSVHFTMGQLFYNDTKIWGEKKDAATSTIFGLVFFITPFLYSENFYKPSVVIFSHFLHFLEIIVINIIWAVGTDNSLVPHLYYLIFSFGYVMFIIGIFFFVLFKLSLRNTIL